MKETPYSFFDWFVQNWSRAALPAVLLLILLSPFLLEGLGWIELLIFLHLPIYMLHQYEEHAQGQFQAFVNEMMQKREDVLTDTAVFWINILLVWALTLLSLYLAHYVNVGLGLMTVYLTLLNGLGHVLLGVRRRRYNPGFWTSLLLFLPVSGFTLFQIAQTAVPGLLFHGVGLATAVLGHALILVYARRRLHELSLGGSQ